MSTRFDAVKARVTAERARKFLAELDALKFSTTKPEELFIFLGRAAGVIDGLLEVTDPGTGQDGGRS
ncbi:hypothetical protein [Streptomyces asiaticus]|uniref:hypothetical protein n=1 Tax=Streptomyces asiaticus TaxID=114695 RepID=UPI003813B6EF